MDLGIFVNPSQSIEPDIASAVCKKHGFVFEREKRKEGGGVHKPVEVIAYPGQPHSFYWGVIGDQAAGEKFFNDAQAFFKKYLKTQPKPLDESLVKRVPIAARSDKKNKSKNGS